MGYYHESAGAWVHADIQPELARAVRLSRVRYTSEDIVIQFRCAGCTHPMYGFPLWPYYYTALHRHANDVFARVLVIHDPTTTNPRQRLLCDAILRAMRFCIQQFFGMKVRVRVGQSLIEDVATMMHARVFVASVSLLGLFAAAASAGTAYVPQSVVTGGGQQPCLGHIRWLPTMYLDCAKKYPINRQTSERLANVFLGPYGAEDLRKDLEDAIYLGWNDTDETLLDRAKRANRRIRKNLKSAPAAVLGTTAAPAGKLPGHPPAPTPAQ